MGERKVLNKYIPADFDPSLVPKGKKLSSKDGTVPVRMMLPFSIQCGTCNTFLYRGRKFNSKKEPMGGPDGKYLGITRFRFYIKCTACARPVTFLTDPQHADYEMESGGSRNYEVYKDKAKTEEEALAEQEQEEKEDPMKALENRVLDSQREMADFDNLEEIKAMNARHVKLMAEAGDPEKYEEETRALLERRDRQEAGKDGSSGAGSKGPIELTEEDEALVRSIQFGNMKKASKPRETNSIRRLDDADEERMEKERQLKAARMEEQQQQQRRLASQAQPKKSTMPVIKAKRKRSADAASAATTAAAAGEDGANNKAQKTTGSSATAPVASSSTGAAASGGAGGGLAGLLGGYSSSSNSD